MEIYNYLKIRSLIRMKKTEMRLFPENWQTWLVYCAAWGFIKGLAFRPQGTKMRHTVMRGIEVVPE